MGKQRGGKRELDDKGVRGGVRGVYQGLNLILAYLPQAFVHALVCTCNACMRWTAMKNLNIACAHPVGVCGFSEGDGVVPLYVDRVCISGKKWDEARVSFFHPSLTNRIFLLTIGADFVSFASPMGRSSRLIPTNNGNIDARVSGLRANGIAEIVATRRYAALKLVQVANQSKLGSTWILR